MAGTKEKHCLGKGGFSVPFFKNKSILIDGFIDKIIENHLLALTRVCRCNDDFSVEDSDFKDNILLLF